LFDIVFERGSLWTGSLVRERASKTRVRASEETGRGWGRKKWGERRPGKRTSGWKRVDGGAYEQRFHAAVPGYPLCTKQTKRKQTLSTLPTYLESFVSLADI